MTILVIDIFVCSAGIFPFEAEIRSRVRWFFSFENEDKAKSLVIPKARKRESHISKNILIHDSHVPQVRHRNSIEFFREFDKNEKRATTC